MLRLASDADVHGAIIRGLRRRSSTIDIIRIQDVLPIGAPDPEVLTWVAAENRVLISNDRSTMIRFFHERVASQQNVPGLLITNREQSIHSAIDDILLIVECLSEQEIENQIIFQPLR